MTPPATAAAPPVRRARTIAPGRPLRTAPRPRRVSGPARPQGGEAARRRHVGAERGLLLGALAVLGRLTGHPLVDRLIRGRTWIAIVAFALIGIVTLQLGLLKLNAGIGRSLARSALLQRENAALSIENSELAAGNRVESAAAKLGMQIVPSGALKFLAAHDHGAPAKAAAALASPMRKSSAASGEASATPASSEGSSESTSHSSTEAPEASGTAASSGKPAASSESGGEAASTPSANSAESGATTPSAGSATTSTSAPAHESPSPAPAAEAGSGGGTQSGPAG